MAIEMGAEIEKENCEMISTALTNFYCKSSDVVFIEEFNTSKHCISCHQEMFHSKKDF